MKGRFMIILLLVNLYLALHLTIVHLLFSQLCNSINFQEPLRIPASS